MTDQQFLRKNVGKDKLNALYADLQKRFPGEYEIATGLNGEMIETLSEKTRLVIVGTRIPSDLVFFYMRKKNNNIYKWIDDAIGTRLDVLKKAGDVDAIKAVLVELGVVFLDVAECCCCQRNNSTDDAIQGYVADAESFQLLKSVKERNPNLRVISTFTAVRFALRKLFSIDSEYVQLAYGRKQPWIDLFKETLPHVIK